MSTTVPRIAIIQRLREELLGPKGGSSEQLLPPTDPREEYTTGVLDAVNLRNGDRDEIELLEAQEPPGFGELDALGDDEEEEDPLILAAEFAPTVDPRRLPCSIGLTFFVKADEAQTLEICVSGGRYRLQDGVWRREARCWRLEPLQPAQWNSDFQQAASGLRVVIRARHQAEQVYRVSVYLLNQGEWDGQSRERASRFLYQPQLRICLSPGASLQGLADWDTGQLDGEERRLQLLYRKSPVMARGHMCAAVWREIDPEQEEGTPFEWVDAQPELEKFRRCDLRTEILPMLAVPTPFADWRAEFGSDPEREARALSELPQDALKDALMPLTLAYEAWLDERDKEARELPATYQPLAQEQVALGREASLRMRDGIELLATNREAYLAFCFANRAVHEQASWSGGVALRWRPFQLGFLLLCLPGLYDPHCESREICDLLWFPTGGGKTEAYLALTAFTLGLRRLRCPGYDGVGVISRYTLRLLSIQQFRRALKLVTACEMLRVEPTGQGIGWRPPGEVDEKNWLWGKHRFSAGLWLGGAVTPNQLEGVAVRDIPGGFDLLEDPRKGESDPAQITECPVCGAHLAISSEEEELPDARLVLHLRVKGYQITPDPAELSTRFVEVLSVDATVLAPSVASLRLELRAPEGGIDVDSWWGEKRKSFGPECFELCVRASRPGYYIECVTGPRGGRAKQRIEVFCPDPSCPTARHEWREIMPVALGGEVGGYQPVPVAVAVDGSSTRARQCPIPAVMVDEQLYAWPPSLLVSTVDKFARLAFESRAACLFGNVEYYHAHEGFYRHGCLRRHLKQKSGHPPGGEKLRLQVDRLPPPDLMIQDELHLIDGPLGSMVGLYETAVSRLCGAGHRLKYVASTATVREAADQVQALFARQLRQFPPPSLDASDSFFALMRPTSVLQRSGPGRLYMGYSAPGRGALTPQVRVWAVLLQAAEELKRQGLSDDELDPYWSPVGYFTTIRNLAATASLWRQAIPLRLEYLGGPERREISPAPMELSSRVSSSRLPGLLNRLAMTYPGAVDSVLSTSMFGTGVDVSRLSLMLVHGQPKTTSAYIQATGRVGRQSPGLIVTALPATNPRSLDHYEFFTGYHRQLYRGVEPVTVYPFAPRARERALGPLCVALLRQMAEVSTAWRDRGTGARMMADAWNTPEVQALVAVFEERAQAQPELRRPDSECLSKEVRDAISAWRAMAEKHCDLQMEEYTLTKRPETPVVLGDPQHEAAKLDVVYARAPQSLREIEPTTGFRI